MVDHLRPPGFEQLVPVLVTVEDPLRPCQQRGGKGRQAMLLIEHGGQVPHIEPSGTRVVGAREVGVVAGQPRRREDGQVPGVQAPHLFLCHADGRGGGDVLGTHAAPKEQRVETRFVQPGHRAQRSRDEVQLVLNDQFRRAPTLARAEECTGSLLPCDPGELVDGADQQRRRLLVECVVHHVARERTAVFAERALTVDTAEVKAACRGVVVGNIERRAAPGALIQQQGVAGRRPARVDLGDAGLGFAECVGGACAAYPDAGGDGLLAE